MSNAVAGYNTQFKRGDGATGSGTKASRTIGTSNSQIVIRAKATGTAGNSKSCQIVVSGNNTALSVSVTESVLTVTSATNGSAAATSTINDIIAALSQDANFLAYWEATPGAGNGTGVLAGASALAFLTGGTNGAEVFTTVAEVSSISGPGLSMDTIEVSNFQSSNRYREFIAGMKDGGEFSLDMNFLPNDSSQTGLLTDFNNGTVRNFQIVFPSSPAVTWSISGLVTGFEPSSSFDDKLSASVTIKVTGQPTFS